MVAIKEAPKITKPKKIGIKSLIPIDTILFSIIFPGLVYIEVRQSTTPEPQG
jgi:hypothetical protein